SKKLFPKNWNSLNTPKDNADGIPSTKIIVPNIHVHFLRCVWSSFVIAAITTSNNGNAEVKAANKNKIKKIVKKNITKSICPKAAGKAINKKPGPTSGSMPIEKTAGKIASPANNATTTFIITTTKAELTKFSSFETYEPYVTWLLNPTLNRKKDCPKAIKMDVACKLVKSKDKK